MVEAFQCAPRVEPRRHDNHPPRAQGMKQRDREQGILFGVMRVAFDLQRSRWNTFAAEDDSHFLAISGAGDEDSGCGALLVQLERARRTMDRFATKDHHHLALDVSAIDTKDLF